MRKYPIGWKTEKLEAVAEFFNGKPLEGRVTPDGNSNLITLDSVDIKGQLKKNHKKLNADGGFLKAGDIVSVLSDIAHGYLLGLSAVIPTDDRYVLNQRMGLLRTSSEIDPNYLRLFINFNQSYFRERGQGTSQRHIYKRDFYDFDFSYPPLSEQTAIAKALSDIDKLIGSMNSEILKKQNILKGFMQSLVAGDYFREKSISFEITQIQNLPIEIKRGHVITGTTKVEGDIPVIAGGISAAYFNNSANRFGTTITISASGANAGFVNLWRSDIWASDCSTIGESELYEVLYIFYVLKEKQKELFDAQYGGGQPHIRPKEIGEIPIPWISKANQKDLVVILEGLSKEISFLETELAKYECIKQGMAHDLLTGKVRLV